MVPPEVLLQVTLEPEGPQEALRAQGLVWRPSVLSQHARLRILFNFLQLPAVPLLAKATYPGKARAGPGSEPTDKK